MKFRKISVAPKRRERPQHSILVSGHGSAKCRECPSTGSPRFDIFQLPTKHSSEFQRAA